MLPCLVYNLMVFNSLTFDKFLDSFTISFLWIFEFLYVSSMNIHRVNIYLLSHCQFCSMHSVACASFSDNHNNFIKLMLSTPPLGSRVCVRPRSLMTPSPLSCPWAKTATISELTWQVEAAYRLVPSSLLIFMVYFFLIPLSYSLRSFLGYDNK